MRNKKTFMNAKNCKYPCTTCNRVYGRGSCDGKYCVKWQKWFNEKWREVTNVIRKDGEENA